MNRRILIVEDERGMADILADNLRAEGMVVDVAADGQVALDRWKNFQPDLVVLDVMLPQINGYEVCRSMRVLGDRTPVLFLSAKGQPEDRVEGLEAGGDDYVTKPFHLPEFMLRVSNMLKRQDWFRQGLEANHSFKFGGHTVDFRSWTAKLKDGRVEQLAERELMIFKLLMERSGGVVSRDQILDTVWGNDVFPSSRTVDNFVVRLRKLFEPDPANPVYFHTIWGVGYRFTPEGFTEQSGQEKA